MKKSQFSQKSSNPIDKRTVFVYNINEHCSLKEKIMNKKGLTSEEITKAASQMIAEVGYANFSLRDLAARLGVRPSSLYNHITGIGEINTAVAVDASLQMNRRIEEATRDLPPEEAFLKGLAEYRAFASENPEIYKALFRMPEQSNDEELLRRATLYAVRALRLICLDFELDDDDMIHFMRCLRSTLHGFVSLTAEGFLLRGGVPRDESFAVLSQMLLNQLKSMSPKYKKGEEEK
ncbi:MAG: TetR/AcrR family transcriptional regulator [Ruminococcaceae bacterium]|nr:TetR/AcrR family transcriptional regulator [Oscillospiraceae bacterium]